MNFNLNSDDYSKDDYLDIFNLDKSMNISQNKVNESYNNLLNSINNEELDLDKKKEMIFFLRKCRDSLLLLVNENIDNYKLIESNFIPDLDVSETFKTNSNFIIKKQENPDENQTNKINPISRKIKTQLLNINTKFRKNYYNTDSTDFIIDLPEEFKNVISLSVQNVDIPETEYTFSSDRKSVV